MHQTGYVNWPTEDPYRDTGEGGLVVHLLIRAPHHHPDFHAACGPTTHVTSSDVHIFPRDFDGPHVVSGSVGHVVYDNYGASRDNYLADRDKIGGSVVSQQYNREDEVMFPNIYRRTEGMSYAEICKSAPLYAAVCLGQTNQSWHDEETGYFKCEYAHLTDAGKQLYDSLRALYGVGDDYVHILTTLDT